jgi:hypothetical protein
MSPESRQHSSALVDVGLPILLAAILSALTLDRDIRFANAVFASSFDYHEPVIVPTTHSLSDCFLAEELTPPYPWTSKMVVRVFPTLGPDINPWEKYLDTVHEENYYPNGERVLAPHARFVPDLNGDNQVCGQEYYIGPDGVAYSMEFQE